MMMDSTQPKSQDIPFLIDGVVKIVKSVTKHTTCNDVINKLPNLQCPLAVYESVDGIERELSGKTKLLKVWRTHGTSSKVVFVVKKSEDSVLKRRRSSLFNVTRKVLKPQTKRRNSKENLKKVSDLAFYVRYQKSKVQSMKRKFDDLESDEDRSKGLKQFRSTSSMDSMDKFLVKTDLDKMEKFLSFCGGVTEEQMGLRKVSKVSRDQDNYVTEPEIVLDLKDTKKSIMRTSFRNVKLGFKQKFASNKSVKRTTSTGTISSADTGYQSVSSTRQTSGVTSKPAGLPKRHTFILPDIEEDAPRHSTPVTVRTVSSCQQQDHDTSLALSDFDENEGKDALLQKFMADQEVLARRSSIDCDDFLSVSQQPVQRSRSDRYSLPAFTSQKDRCRYLWNMYCDSDSDSSSVSDVSDLWEASQLDNAFIDSVVDISTSDVATPRNRTLRRESAISNLARFSMVTKPINIEDDEDSFDYSFNCTFPRMDESQTDNLTSCFGNEATYNGDFNTMSCDVDFDGDITKEFDESHGDVDVTKELLKDICDSDDSFEESDEGLGSMSSGSVQEIMYI